MRPALPTHAAPLEMRSPTFCSLPYQRNTRFCRIERNWAPRPDHTWLIEAKFLDSRDLLFSELLRGARFRMVRAESAGERNGCAARGSACSDAVTGRTLGLRHDHDRATYIGALLGLGRDFFSDRERIPRRDQRSFRTAKV